VKRRACVLPKNRVTSTRNKGARQKEKSNRCGKKMDRYPKIGENSGELKRQKPKSKNWKIRREMGKANRSTPIL